MTRPGVGPIFACLAAGAAAGASVGLWAGPLTALVGMGIGGIIGLSSAFALESFEARNTEHERRLDRDIGVYDGDIGAGSVLHHEPPTLGAYSAAVAGYAADYGDHTPAEGPFAEPQ